MTLKPLPNPRAVRKPTIAQIKGWAREAYRKHPQHGLRNAIQAGRRMAWEENEDYARSKY